MAFSSASWCVQLHRNLSRASRPASPLHYRHMLPLAPSPPTSSPPPQRTHHSPSCTTRVFCPARLLACVCPWHLSLCGAQPLEEGQSRQWEDWEYTWTPMMLSALGLYLVAYYYRPYHSMDEWARARALERMAALESDAEPAE